MNEGQPTGFVVEVRTGPVLRQDESGFQTGMPSNEFVGIDWTSHPIHEPIAGQRRRFLLADKEQERQTARLEALGFRSLQGPAQHLDVDEPARALPWPRP